MQRFSMNASADPSCNNGIEAPASAEARPAEQPAPAVLFTPLVPKGRAPGLAVRTQLKAGYHKIDKSY
jgi:hypothetical protein